MKKLFLLVLLLSINAFAVTHKVTVKWIAPKHTPFTGFHVYRAPMDTGIYQQVGNRGSQFRQYVDKNVSNGGQYKYKVRAVNGTTESTDSNVTIAIIPAH